MGNLGVVRQIMLTKHGKSGNTTKDDVNKTWEIWEYYDR